MISRHIFDKTTKILCRNFSSVWEKRVNDFTPVHIETQSDVHIQQYDFKEDPIAPKTKIILPESGVEFSHTDKIEITNRGSAELITAQIPLKSPLFVNCTQDASVYITGHEADISIKADSGCCVLNGVKCKTLSIISSTSDVELNSVVSNCSIMTKGNVSARKIQGESMTISNTKGSVRIEALYASESRIYGKYGDIEISNVHGTCKIVNGTGSVTIGSSKDNLDIKCRGGAVRVTLQDIDKFVSIQSFGGPVILLLSDKVCDKAALTIQSSETAKVMEEIQERILQNEDASALIKVNVYDGMAFVGRAKSWGEDMLDKLKKKD